MLAWWAQSLEPSLSQGDIVTGLHVWAPEPGNQFIEKQTVRHGRTAWFDCQSPKKDAASGRPGVRGWALPISVIVLSHSCDLDKDGNNRVLVAPIASIDSVEEELRSDIVERRAHSKIPLLAMPTLGSQYADLRSMSMLHRQLVDNGTRIASMTAQGVEEVQNQLIVALTRLDAAELRVQLSQGNGS